MESGSTATARHTCLKLEIPSTDPLFVKGTWFTSHFDLSVTDGLHAWVCNATDEEVQERAAQWDQPVAEYIELAERYLGFQQPGSVYRFVDAGDEHKRLSWTFEKEGTKLEWRWKFQPSVDSRKITAGILDFLMDANIRLSEEVVRKSQSFEKLRVESEKCLEQSERFTNEKMEFESEIYAKFLGVLNSKKQNLGSFEISSLNKKLQEKLRWTRKNPLIKQRAIILEVMKRKVKKKLQRTSQTHQRMFRQAGVGVVVERELHASSV